MEWDEVYYDNLHNQACDVAENQWVIRPADTTLKIANADTDIHLSFSTGGNHYTEIIDVSDLTYVGTSIGSTAWEFDLYGQSLVTITDTLKSNSKITSVTVTCRMRRQALGGPILTEAEGRATLKTYGIRHYGTEVILTSAFINHDFDFPTNPVTGEEWTWAELETLQVGVEMHTGVDGAGNRRAEASTVTTTINYTESLIEGTVVEMSTTVPAELVAVRAEALADSQRLAILRPAKNRVNPFHKHIGLTCAWEKSTNASTNMCPAVISTNPGTIMNGTWIAEREVDNGNVKPIVVAGTAQNVYVTGAYAIGDKLVSNGDGTAVVDNGCAFDELLGYAKEAGANAKIEVWIR